jgi:hypothetical protein
MNKVIQISSHKKTVNTINESTIDIEDATKKINNEKMKNEKKSYIDLLDKVGTKEVSKDISNAIITIYDNYDIQLALIQKLYKGTLFYEQKYFSQALKNKLDCYKQQDIKKKYDDYNNFITLENIIEKLATSEMLCFYCNVKTLILYKNSREQCQWTLDRINNYDEHSNSNTIICCLKCNLQRRRKNSAKFKFSKQLEHNLIVLKKLE